MLSKEKAKLGMQDSPEIPAHSDEEPLLGPNDEDDESYEILRQGSAPGKFTSACVC